ncbi:hypothetical protein ABIE78_000502 [Sinorhizobium fredii]
MARGAIVRIDISQVLRQGCHSVYRLPVQQLMRVNA